MIAFAAAFAVASSMSDDDEATRTVPSQLVLPTKTPAAHNLERVDGIKPLREAP